MALFPLEVNKKITMFLAGCIALGLIALAAWMWLQAIEPALEENVSQQSSGASDDINTSDWETYRNEEWGFELRYPGDWGLFTSSDYTEEDLIRNVYDHGDGQQYFVNVKNVSKQEHPSCGGVMESPAGMSILISVYNNDSTLTYQDIIEDCGRGSEVGFCDARFVDIDGTEALMIESGNALCDSFPRVHVLSDDKHFIISSEWSTDGFDIKKQQENIDVFNALITTVELL